MDYLSYNVKLLIFSYLDSKSRLCLMSTCSTWNSLGKQCTEKKDLRRIRKLSRNQKDEHKDWNSTHKRAKENPGNFFSELQENIKHGKPSEVIEVQTLNGSFQSDKDNYNVQSKQLLCWRIILYSFSILIAINVVMWLVM